MKRVSPSTSGGASSPVGTDRSAGPSRSVHTSDARDGWPKAVAVEDVSRRLAVATAAGALSGLLVGGVGGRLAMMLLARLAPETAGVVSDDGFVIGQITLSGTINLLVLGTFLGVLGGGIYVVLRSLLIGPRWLQVLSISIGPAVVVGAMLVHTDGVDFTLLRPSWVAITMFVAVPGLYAALLTVLCERWLRPTGRLRQAPRRVALAPLVLWLPLAPLLLLGALGWLFMSVLRGHPATRRLVDSPLASHIARLVLIVTFAWALTGLVQDVAALT